VNRSALELESRALRYGWLISSSYGSNGFLVQANRAAVGGKFGPATEYDETGLAFVKPELGDARAQLVTVLVEAVEDAETKQAVFDDSEPRMSSERDLRTGT